MKIQIFKTKAVTPKQLQLTEATVCVISKR